MLRNYFVDLFYELKTPEVPTHVAGLFAKQILGEVVDNVAKKATELVGKIL